MTSQLYLSEKERMVQFIENLFSNKYGAPGGDLDIDLILNYLQISLIELNDILENRNRKSKISSIHSKIKS